MWMARCGMVRSGLPMSMRRTSGSYGFSPASTTLPASDSGRSSQELRIMPPYTSILSVPYPFVATSANGLTRRQGKSVCAVATCRCARGSSPMRKATSVESKTRVMYDRPGCRRQGARRSSSVKPASCSISSPACTAWNGVTARCKNERKSKMITPSHLLLLLSL